MLLRHARLPVRHICAQSRAPARAMLRGVGFLDEDFNRPMIGVASLFSDITPCNAHLDRLARKGVEGIRAAGGVPQIFGAPTLSAIAHSTLTRSVAFHSRAARRSARSGLP